MHGGESVRAVDADHDHVRLVHLRANMPIEVGFLIVFGARQDAHVEGILGPRFMQSRIVGRAQEPSRVSYLDSTGKRREGQKHQGKRNDRCHEPAAGRNALS